MKNPRLVLPLYAQVKEALIARLENGEYVPGDQIPSQRDLMGTYSASHMTIRRVINELIQEGYIYPVPGKGLYVSSPKQQAESGPLMSFTQEMRQRVMTASSRVLIAALVTASTPLARTLEIDPGAPLVFLRRLRLADGMPMALQSSYLRAALVPDLLSHDLETQSLYDLLANVYNLRLADGEVSVEAVLADDEQAELLGATQPCALLVAEQITHLETGEPFEFTRSIYRGDRYRMRTPRP
jgi:GntR family transcriptional regulator